MHLEADPPSIPLHAVMALSRGFSKRVYRSGKAINEKVAILNVGFQPYLGGIEAELGLGQDQDSSQGLSFLIFFGWMGVGAVKTKRQLSSMCRSISSA